MTPQKNKGKERCSPEPQTQPPSQNHDPDMPSSSSSFPSSSSSSSVPSSSSSAADYLAPPFVYPPGYRFNPTDEELIFYHLKHFPEISWPNAPIHDVNIYESNPQQLTEEYEKGNLKEWFFRWERTNKGSKRQKRGDIGGYWHQTGAAKRINAGQGVFGYRATLDYRVGVQPNGVKTNWLMQEYCLDSNHDKKTASYALCKIYLTPRAKKKTEEDNVEALIQEVEQPRNVEYQQPQPQFWPTPLNSHQPQPLDNIGYQQSHQPQFFPSPVDSRQSQALDIAYYQPQPQPLDNIGYQQSHQPQFWPAPLYSHQPQPRDIADDENFDEIRAFLGEFTEGDSESNTINDLFEDSNEET